MADPANWFRTGSLADTYKTFRNLVTSEAAVRALPEVLEVTVLATTDTD